MMAIDIEVLPDSYIGHKKKIISIIVAYAMCFGIAFSLFTQHVSPIYITMMLSAILLVALFYFEYVRRPVRLRITDKGVTLFFNRLKPRFYPWSRIIEVFVLKQVPKMRGVMPTRGGFMIVGDRTGYGVDEQAARDVVKAYTEIFDHPPRVKDASDDCVFWEINPA